MIEVRRISERGSLDFEVVVREGVGELVTTSRCRVKCANGSRPAGIRPSAVWRRPSVSCSTASQRNQFSDAST